MQWNIIYGYYDLLMLDKDIYFTLFERQMSQMVWDFIDNTFLMRTKGQISKVMLMSLINIYNK